MKKAIPKLKEIGFWTLSIARIFNRLNTQYTTFRRLDLFRLQVKRKRGKKEGKTPILLEAYFFDSATIVRTLQN
jgi:hypothetical protein